MSKSLNCELFRLFVCISLYVLVCMYQFVCISLYGCMDGCMYGWMYGWMEHGKYRAFSKIMVNIASSNIQTYKHPNILIKVTIQTFRHLKGRITLYVKPYSLDKTHAIRGIHTYIHFKSEHFWPYLHFRILGIYRQKNGKPSKTSKMNCYIEMYVWRNAVNIERKWVKPPKYISM